MKNIHKVIKVHARFSYVNNKRNFKILFVVGSTLNGVSVDIKKI